MKPIILKLAGVWLASVPALDAATYHVVPPGVGTNPVPNYTSWATAATNIHDVMNRVTHGDTVLVSNGCYRLANVLGVYHAITVRSWNDGELDPEGTILDGNNYAGKAVTNNVFNIQHASALVEGFTITNGRYRASGGGVTMTGGTLRRCRIAGNAAIGWGNGGGLSASGANCLVSDCDIVGNLSTNEGGGAYLASAARMQQCRVVGNQAVRSQYSSGGGVRMDSGALVSHCTIADNACLGSTPHWGGGVSCTASTLRNCLIAGNTASHGAGVSVGSSAILENCTVADNDGTFAGLYLASGITDARCANSIVYHNTGTEFYQGTPGSLFSNTCCSVTNNMAGSGNFTAAPEFIDRPGGDFRLAGSSPCVNAGLRLEWMAGAQDLEGQPRLDTVTGQADLGCYEHAYTGSVLVIR